MRIDLNEDSVQVTDKYSHPQESIRTDRGVYIINALWFNAH